MRFTTKSQKLAELLEAVELPPGTPESALKTMREQTGKHQLRLANEAGVSQGYLSEVESGKKPLTPAVAEKVAPVLGVTAAELEAAEQMSLLHRMALKGAVDPQRLLDAVTDLSSSLPDGEVSDALVDALLGVLKMALSTYDQHSAAVAKVSTKSRAPGRTRDGLGRRVGKPYGGM